MDERASRRAFLGIAGASILLGACREDERARADQPKPEGEPEVGATEDLMREHGVIRRVLVVYREAAARLHARPAAVPADALQRAAQLMRSFAEDYHEKQLEEAYLFPELVKSGGSLTDTIHTLTAQHRRGREITGYVLAVTRRPISADSARPLALALESFARMYEAHAALEDTVVFPAWKKALGPKALAEAGERFEAIEHEFFGKDGFEDAVARVDAIERSFGLTLAQLTAPPAPVL